MELQAVLWESVAVPCDGAVTGLVLSPAFARDGMCFAATMAGLFRSEDAGERWKRIGDLIPAQPLTAIAISPSFGEDSILLVADLAAGVYRVVEDRWVLSDLAGYQVHVAALDTSPNFSADATAFAASLTHGIFCTRNRGLHWETCNFGLLDLEVLALGISPCYGQDETIFAATATGLYRSRSGGRAWRELGILQQETPILCLAISPDFGREAIVFAGTDGAGLFRSQDGGATWHHCGDLPGDACINGVACSPAFAVDRTVAVITDSAVYVSHSGGEHWVLSTEAPDPLCIALAPTRHDTDLLLVGLTHGGILRARIHGPVP